MKHEFVNLYQTPHKKDEEFKKKVRAMSMRQYRRQERDRQAAKFQRSKADTRQSSPYVDNESPKTESSKDSDDIVYPITQSMNEQDQLDFNVLSTEFNQGSWLAADLVDPFDSMSMPMSKSSQGLLNHFENVLGPMMMPLRRPFGTSQWSTEWLRCALESPLLLLAVCTHSSKHIDVASSKLQSMESRQTTQLKSSTMRAMNERIRAADGKPDDALIGATIMLAANMMITGEYHELSMHMDAFRRMVTMRGGIANLGFDGMLGGSFGWHYSPTVILGHKSPEPAHAVAHLCDFSPIDRPPTKDLLQIANKILATLEKSRAGQDIYKDEYYTFSEDRSSMDFSLISIVYSDHASDTSILDRYTAFALLMLSISVFRKWIPRCQTYKALSKKMYAFMCGPGAELLANPDPESRDQLFWVFSVAAALDSGQPEQEVYRSTFADLSRRLGFGSEVEVFEFLGRFVWSEFMTLAMKGAYMWGHRVATVGTRE